MVGRSKRSAITILNSRDFSLPMRTIFPIVLSVLTLVFSGCGPGSNEPPTVSVKGTVTLGGKPLEGANVYYFSEQYSSAGKTDAAGVYELTKGALPGENTVYISKISVPEGALADSDGGVDEGQLMAMAGDPALARSKSGPKEIVPVKYSDPSKTELTITVPESGTEAADFALEAK